MAKKDKLTVINATVPASLKAYAQDTIEKRGYDSISDYIRSLIRADQKRSKGDDVSYIIESITAYLQKQHDLPKNRFRYGGAVAILQEKLATIGALFELGMEFRAHKIKKEATSISKDELDDKLTAWSLNNLSSEETPGFIEVSEKRRQKLINEQLS